MRREVDRRSILKTGVGSTLAVGLAGCVEDILGDDERAGSDIPLEEGGRMEDHQVMTGTNNELLPKHVPWQIKIDDQTGTLGNHIEQGETHRLNTSESHYEDNFQTTTVEDMTEETWKNIIRDDLKEKGLAHHPNQDYSMSPKERQILNEGGTVEEILKYPEELFQLKEQGQLDNFEAYEINPRISFRYNEQNDNEHWTELLYLGLQQGGRQETDVSSSGGFSEQIRPLFVNYAEEELGLELLEDFHVWEIGTETTEKDDWELNHITHGLAYKENEEWHFKLVEPTPTDGDPYISDHSETIRDPEETKYLNDSKTAVWTFSPNKALEMAEKGELSTNDPKQIHYRLGEHLIDIVDNNRNFVRPTRRPGAPHEEGRHEGPKYWFSNSFRESVEDNFTGDFTEENLWNGIYTGRAIAKTKNYIGNNKPLVIEGTIEEPSITYAPEEMVEELVENDYDSVDELPA